MGTRRALTRILGRTRQLPAGDVLNGVYPPYTPVFKTAGAMLTVYRRDGVEQGVAAHVPAYQASGAELQVATDASFAVVVTQVAGTTRLVNAGVAGVTQKIPVQFANLAGFPAIGSPERLYIAVDTKFEYLWTGNGYVLASSLAGSSSIGTTDDLPEGTTNLYFTAGRVLSTVLSGLVTTTNSAITAADTLLIAMGKLQAQLNNKLGLTSNAVSATKLNTARNINTVPFDGTADIAIANVTTGIEAGYGSNNGGSADWGANIWGMGPAYDGTGLAATYVPTGQYGVSWLRASHASADADVGEGLYVYQNGVFKGGVGSSGAKTAGTFTGDGSGITGLNAASLASGTVPSGRLTGSYAISVTGNAGTATVLQTARTINGVSFNGSANITIPSGGVFSETYTSANIAFANGTTTTLSHGLSGVPKLIIVRAVCISAFTPWAVGEEIEISTVQRTESTAETHGCSVSGTSTSLILRYANKATNVLIGVISTSGLFAYLDPSSFRLRIYAYY